MAALDLVPLVVAMGGSDCELIRRGWLAQPANAWSSGAYLAAAAYVLVRRRGAAVGAAPPGLAAALALGAVAVGSFLYHGPQPSWGEAVHDTAITALLVALLVRGAVGRMGDTRGLAAVVLAAIVLTAAVPSSLSLVQGVLVGLVALAEARSPRPTGVERRVAMIAFGAAVGLFLLGRTDAPLCVPRSLMQPHAGWHVLSAVAVAALLARDLSHPSRRPTAR